MHSIQQLELIAALARHRHFGRAAEELGISQPWYSDIEIGKCAPDVKLALRIVAIVGGSLEDYWTADTVEVSR